MPRGLFRIEWCLILIIIIIPVVTYIINIIININLIFFIIILLIYIITIFLWVILLLVFMTATFGSYWLINKLSKCIKGSRLFYTYNMPTLPDCQGVSQTQNKTLHGSAIWVIKPLRKKRIRVSSTQKHNIWTPDFPHLRLSCLLLKLGFLS